MMRNKRKQQKRKETVVKHRGLVKFVRSREELDRQKSKTKKTGKTVQQREKYLADIQATLITFEAADEVDPNRDQFVHHFLPQERFLLRTIIRLVKGNSIRSWTVTINGKRIHCTREILVDVLKGDPRFATKSRARLYSVIGSHRTWINKSLAHSEWHPEQWEHARIGLLFIGERNEIGNKINISDVARELQQNDPLFVQRTFNAINALLHRILRDENILRDAYPTLSSDTGRCDTAATSLRPRVIHCKANKMGPSHRKAFLTFVKGSEYEHGAKLTCSHADCKKGGVKFKYCGYCDKVVYKKDIRKHSHPNESLPTPCKTHVIHCKAIGKGPSHENAVLTFDKGSEYEHGEELTCSHAGCRSDGVKFRYCKHCDMAVSKELFPAKHHHPKNQDEGSETNTSSQSDDCEEARERVIFCKARGMTLDHVGNNAVLTFDTGFEFKHGAQLRCSDVVCRKDGVKFRYCKHCDKAAATSTFGKRHSHPEIPDETNTSSQSDDCEEAQERVIFCKARGMNLEHVGNNAVLTFDTGFEFKHGAKLTCSDVVCRKDGVKFRYCKHCDKAASTSTFRAKHSHPEIPDESSRMNAPIRPDIMMPVLPGNPFKSDVCLPALPSVRLPNDNGGSAVHLPNDNEGSQSDTRQLEQVDIVDISSSKDKVSSSSSKGSMTTTSSKNPKSSKSPKSPQEKRGKGKGSTDEHEIPYYQELVEWVLQVEPEILPSPTLDTNVEDNDDNLEPLSENDDELYENFFGLSGGMDEEGLFTFDESSEENDDDRKPPAKNDDDRKPRAENGEDHEPSVNIRNFTML